MMAKGFYEGKVYHCNQVPSDTMQLRENEWGVFLEVNHGSGTRITVVLTRDDMFSLYNELGTLLTGA